MSERESVKILRECIEVQNAKSADYQNPASSVKQADYYPNGIATLHDILHAKMLRAKSLIESGNQPNNESLEDSYKDLINYASFAVAWLRGGIPGQDPNRDHLNRPIAEVKAKELRDATNGAVVDGRQKYSGKVPATSSTNIFGGG
jgi:hypothetical protein